MYKNMKKLMKKLNILWKIISIVKTWGKRTQNTKMWSDFPSIMSKAGLITPNYQTTSYYFFSILKTLVLGTCPTVIRCVSAHLHKTCSNFPVSQTLLDSCYFSKNHPFRKPYLSLLPKSNINIFSLTLDAPVVFNCEYPSQTEIFPRDLKAHSFMSHGFSNDTLYVWKNVNYQHSFSALECPKITGFKTVTSLCPKKYGLACHFLQIPLSPALVGSL